MGMDDVPYRLTVERFNEIVAPLVGQTIQTCRRAMDEAGVSAPELSAVLMVGGTSRIPLVQEMARKIAGKPALCATDLELAVVQGALMYNEYQKREAKRQEAEAQEKAKQEAELLAKKHQEKAIRKISPEKEQTSSDTRERNLSAAEYFELGQKAAAREAWGEASEYYRKAAILGHVFALRELSSIEKRNAHQKAEQKIKKDGKKQIQGPTTMLQPEKGKDLYTKINITPWEAARGCTKDVTVQDSNGTRTLKVIVPKGIDDGRTLCLNGLGASGKNGSPQGDLYVIVNVKASAEEYFEQGRRAAARQAWDETAEYYRKAASMGHRNALRELDSIIKKRDCGIQETVPQNGPSRTTVQRHSMTAEEYFQQGRGAIARQAWDEAAKYYHKAASMGHRNALRELDKITNKYITSDSKQVKPTPSKTFTLTIANTSRRRPLFPFPFPFPFPMDVCIDNSLNYSVKNDSSVQVKLAAGKHSVDITSMAFLVAHMMGPGPIIREKHLSITLNSDAQLLLSWNQILGQIEADYTQK